MVQEQQNHLFTNSGPLQTSSLKEQAYKLIKDAILYRRLKLNIVYSQDDLCSELGISRTPVREALIELISDGLVVFVRRRGFKIVELTRKEALDIIEVRSDLEKFGAELAAQRISDEQLERLEDKYNEMVKSLETSDSMLMYKLDYDFHNIIFEATGNNWLLGAIKKLRDNFLRIETQSAFSKKTSAKAVFTEHYKILKAIQKRDPDLARAAMQNHLEHTYHRTLANILEKEQKK